MSEPTVIFETVHGSSAYGLSRDGSDLDVKGVLIGPAPWYLGFRGGPEQIDLSPDHTRYEIRKFFRLAAAANPTALELLWTRPEDHRVLTPVGERLLAARDAFLSRRVAERFGRYALSQMKRIRSHRTWLFEPPSGPPQRSDFGLPDRTVIPADQLAAAEHMLRREATEEADAADVSPNFIELLTREKHYKAAQLQWRHYTDWRTNRNPARAALEARFGYDTKHAMHLVRLQRMAFEILDQGEVHVFRTDADELLAIRDGDWTYDDLVVRTGALGDRIDRVAVTSALPAEPDEAALDDVCTALVADQLER